MKKAVGGGWGGGLSRLRLGEGGGGGPCPAPPSVLRGPGPRVGLHPLWWTFRAFVGAAPQSGGPLSPTALPRLRARAPVSSLPPPFAPWPPHPLLLLILLLPIIVLPPLLTPRVGRAKDPSGGAGVELEIRREGWGWTWRRSAGFGRTQPIFLEDGSC